VTSLVMLITIINHDYLSYLNIQYCSFVKVYLIYLYLYSPGNIKNH
jgi:hypothetical protein